ncbi:MAG: threonine/serine dehydratase [Armatimonadetes bacterium]|nr:threonine/serine dehydratase [Armatimonadota bacterium]
MSLPTIEDIQQAAARIAAYVLPTPIVNFWKADPSVWLKLESLQVTGSFKARGAFSHLLGRLGDCRRGVITASSGNHGQAVAYAARKLGVPAVVVVPENVVPIKADGIRKFGAEVVRCGFMTKDRYDKAVELAAARGLHVIPSYDDRHILTGQGSIGLEIVRDHPDVDEVYVPCGGGGLVSGVSLAIKSVRPDIRVIGAEPVGGACFYASWKAGEITRLATVDTIADGLRAIQPGDLTWAVASRHVDDFVTVGDDAVLTAMKRLLIDGKVLVEPSGAVTVAAALQGSSSKRRVAVVSGGNADPELVARLLA